MYVLLFVQKLMNKIKVILIIVKRQRDLLFFMTLVK